MSEKISVMIDESKVDARIKELGRFCPGDCRVRGGDSSLSPALSRLVGV